MKILIPSLFWATIVISHPISALEKVDSPQLEVGVFNWRPAGKNQYKYMASLQLDGHHVCAAGLFKEGFLITTCACTQYIARCMRQGKQRSTAVLGEKNLEAGQRVNVLRVAHTDRIVSNRDGIGMVMLAEDIDYTRVQVMNLYEKQLDLRKQGKDALVCGWRTVTKEIKGDALFSDAENAASPHCSPLSIANREDCRKYVGLGDFRKRLACAKLNSLKGETALGDIGSPVTQAIEENGTLTNYVIGIVLSTNQNKRDPYLRMRRTSAILKETGKMMKVLQSPEEGRIECSSSSDEDCTNESNKRSKI